MLPDHGEVVANHVDEAGEVLPVVPYLPFHVLAGPRAGTLHLVPPLEGLEGVDEG